MARSKTLTKLQKKEVKGKRQARASDDVSDRELPKVVQRTRADSVSSDETDGDQTNGQAVKDSEDDDVEDNGEEESDEDEGVDEEGMQKLLRALGEDGLDEVGRAQLRALAGDEDGERDDEEDEDEDVGLEDAGKAEVEVKSGTDEDAAEDEEDVALDDVSDVASDADIVPRQKIELNNTIALDRIRESIQLDPSLPWTETLVVAYPQTIEVDVHDDLNRELAFYKQALHSATTAHTLAQKLSFPFTRPTDFFAEMVKSDAHMQRIRQRLLDEQAEIKKSEDKRKEREGKKFGKQVQMEKLKERERSKKDMEERVKGLKRKRKGVLDSGAADDDFDIAVEDAISDRPQKRTRGSPGGDSKRAKMPRHARDSKFGFGGPGKRAKQNSRASTDDFGGGGGRGAKSRRGGTGGAGRGGGGQRPGKARRMAVKGRS